MDTNKEYVDTAKKKTRNNNVEFHLMSADKLLFENDSFDAVIMIEVLEHVIDDEKTIAEINRVLKSNGKFIVTAPNKLFPFETHGLRIGNKIYGSSGFGFPLVPWLPEFLRKHIVNAKVYTPYGLKNLLKRNGFFIYKTNFIGPSLDVLSIKFPRFRFITQSIINLYNIVEDVPLINNSLTTIVIMAKKVE